MSGDRSAAPLGQRRLRGIVMLAVVAIVALVVAGCGSSSSSSSSTTGKAAATVNPKVANKTVGFVDILGVSAVEKRFYKAFTSAATLAGWKVQFVDGEGNPSKILGAAQNFVNSGVDALVFNSVPAEMVRPAVKQAKAKGIPSINLVTPATPGTFDGDYDENEAVLGPPLAQKIEQDFPSGAHVGLLVEPALSSSRARVAALKKAWAGTNVKVIAESAVAESSPDAAGKSTIDLLNAHPDINVIVGIFDQFSSASLAALRTSQKPNVKYYSFYADSVNVPLMKRANSPFVAVVDSNIAEVGYVAVDQLLKHFATGAAVEGQTNIPIKPLVVTKANLPTGDLDEGPVPFSQIAAPYLKRWETEYGIKQGG